MKPISQILAVFIIALLLPLSGLSKVHLVSIGISDYPGSENDLSLPHKDAISMKALIDVNVDGATALLTNSQATKDNILSTIKSLFRYASTDDVVIIFFSGHGYQGGLYAYDGRLPYEDVRSAMAITHCKNKMIFVDACFSGKMRQGKRETKAENRNSNVMLFLSSRDNETSIEMPSMSNGFFTTCLVDGMKGKADSNYDRIITAKELFTYVSKNVKLLSSNRQHPVMWGNFSDSMVVISW